jgi:hypothetical protein
LAMAGWPQNAHTIGSDCPNRIRTLAVPLCPCPWLPCCGAW